MITKIIKPLILATVLMLNHSCFYMNYNFKGVEKVKDTAPEVFFKDYDLKLSDTKIDIKNKSLTGKVQFVPEYQQKVIKQTKSTPGGDISFAVQALVKVPLFLGSLYFFGTEANKGNINIPFAIISSLFALDFISWGIIDSLDKPTHWDYYLKEEITKRDELKSDKYENLVEGKIAINCNKILYNLNTNEEGIISILEEDIKNFTTNGSFNKNCYIAAISLQNKKELKIKNDLKLFSWLPVDYTDIFNNQTKKNEKVDLHIKNESSWFK